MLQFIFINSFLDRFFLPAQFEWNPPLVYGRKEGHKEESGSIQHLLGEHRFDAPIINRNNDSLLYEFWGFEWWNNKLLCLAELSPFGYIMLKVKFI